MAARTIVMAMFGIEHIKNVGAIRESPAMIAMNTAIGNGSIAPHSNPTRPLRDDPTGHLYVAMLSL